MRIDSPATSGPLVSDTEVVFELADPAERFTEVRLCQDLMRPRCGLALERPAPGEAWRLRFPRLEVDRMEYRFEVVDAEGNVEQLNDPENPLLAPGPFGEKSVIEFPEYRRPSWLDDPPAGDGDMAEVAVRSRRLGADVRMVLWATPGSKVRDRLPVLVAHDGVDYRDHAALLVFLERMFAQGRVPAMRAALVAPVQRNEHYSASAVYARALAHDIVPALDELLPAPAGRPPRIGMGPSLGALAMFHAHRTNPATFGSLYLQSGSFFRQRFDKQEMGFPRFRRISRFVGAVLNTPGEWDHAVPVVMTCGRAEENLGNNRALHEALVRQGYHATLVENRDAHNWTAWRGTFDPHLTDLIARMWS